MSMENWGKSMIYVIGRAHSNLQNISFLILKVIGSCPTTSLLDFSLLFLAYLGSYEIYRIIYLNLIF